MFYITTYVTTARLRNCNLLKNFRFPLQLDKNRYYQKVQRSYFQSNLLDFYRHQKMGKQFINFIIKMKQGEIRRFLQAVADQSPDKYSKQVTEWEQREYFELF